MLDLSPTKLIIIFVVAIVLLGPKRLPQVARQLGAGWAKLRAYSQRVDSELRQSMPDLPSSQDIVRYARSPITLLNQLADDNPDAAPLAEEPDASAGRSPDAARGLPSGVAPLPRGSDASAGIDPAATRGARDARAEERADLEPLPERADLALLAVDDPTLN